MHIYFLAWLNDILQDDKEGGIAYCLEELDGNAYEQVISSKEEN